MNKDLLPLKGIDHVEFYVGNAYQSACFFRDVFGFRITAYAGLKTERKNSPQKFGFRDKASYLVEQNKIKFVLTSGLHPTSEPTVHQMLHGDGVKVIAFEVDDAEYSFNQALGLDIGEISQQDETIRALGVIKPTELKDENGTVKISAVKTYGETIHKFIERKNYNGIFMPNFVAYTDKSDNGKGSNVGLKEIDHMVGNVEEGMMNYWVKYYTDVFGFVDIATFDKKNEFTKHAKLMSKVKASGDGKIKFPINEPWKVGSKMRSQIQVYLDYYRSAGVQHIAIATDNIIATVKELKRRGVDFQSSPKEKMNNYYTTELKDSIENMSEDWEEIKELTILVDKDEDGYLLQLFTQVLTDRPTYFFEIIQRKGAKTFGEKNFARLADNIDNEQDMMDVRDIVFP